MIICYNIFLIAVVYIYTAKNAKRILDTLCTIKDNDLENEDDKQRKYTICRIKMIHISLWDKAVYHSLSFPVYK